MNYLDKQVNLEDKYYKKYEDILLVLVLILLEQEYLYPSDIYGITEDFLTKEGYNIHKTTADMVNDSYKLAHETVESPEYSIVDMDRDRYQTLHKFKNVVDSVGGRVITETPVNGKMSEESREYLKESLSRRANKSLSDFVQGSVSSMVTNVISRNAKKKGYTHYIGDNKHDEKVRPSHSKDNDGVTWRSLDNPPVSGLPGTEIHCFHPDTLIKFADVIDFSFRSWYTGELVSITTESGNTIITTLDHPIMGFGGFFTAKSFDVGDYLAEVVGISTDSISVRDSDVKNANTSFLKVFNSISDTGVRHVTGGTITNLKFDSVDIFEHNVDIVSPNTRLSLNTYEVRYAHVKKDILIFDMRFMCSVVYFFLLRYIHKFVFRIFSTGSVSSNFLYTLLFLLFGKRFVKDTTCLTGITDRYISTFKNRLDVLRSSFIMRRNGLEGFVTSVPSYNVVSNAISVVPLKTRFSRIVSIERVQYNGHVYNLQCKNEFYVANNIIAHNCRCVYKDFK